MKISYQLAELPINQLSYMHKHQNEPEYERSVTHISRWSEEGGLRGAIHKGLENTYTDILCFSKVPL